jgi:anti-sigma regulatory factor (Ser/Thr protein kinase)
VHGEQRNVTLVVDTFIGAEFAEVGRARRLVAAALAGIDAGPRQDSMQCVSELVTNAVRHGLPPVRLTVELRCDAVRITVADRSLVEPVLSADPALGERGLHIVAALSRTWKVALSPPGKAVRADVPLAVPAVL